MGGGSCFPWFTSALSSWSPSDVSSLKAGGLEGEVILLLTAGTSMEMEMPKLSFRRGADLAGTCRR